MLGRFDICFDKGDNFNNFPICFPEYQSLFALHVRKHAYSNILKILLPKNETFSDKNSDIFHISTQNINIAYCFTI